MRTLSAAIFVLRTAWATGRLAVLMSLGECVTRVLAFLQPVAIDLLITGIVGHHRADVVSGVTLMVAFLGLGGALEAFAVGARVKLIADVGFSFDRQLLVALSRIKRLDELEQPDVAAAVTTAKGRADMMGYAFNGLISVLIQAATPVTSLVAAVVIDPRLLLLVVAGAPTIVAANRIDAAHTAAEEAAEPFSTQAESWAELLQDQRAYAERRVFKLWSWYADKIETALGARESALLTAVIKESWVTLTAQSFYLLSACGILMWIAATSHGHSAGRIVAALLLTLDLKDTLDSLRFAFSRLGPALRGAAAAREVARVAFQADPEAGFASPATSKEPSGLFLSMASYLYPGANQESLTGVTLTIDPGQVVAVVGANGAGKTTLVEILSGLRLPTSGAYRVEPGATTVVAQNFARPEVLLSEAVALTDDSGLSDDQRERIGGLVAEAFPTKTWETDVGGLARQLGSQWTDGIEPSGGQWQALAGARAFYPDAIDLIILDEPTAALDPVAQREMTERYLRTARDVASRGGIAIITAHRMTVPRLADRILVLANGSVVEDGTHEDLLSSGGRYAQAYQLQVDGFMELEYQGSTGPVYESSNGPERTGA